MSTLGKRIVEARTLRGIKRGELAKAAGMTYSTLAGIENGDQHSTTQLPALARALRVRIEWLQDGSAPMDIPTAPEEYDWADLLAYPQAVGLGDGYEGEDYAETHKLKFRASSLRRKHLAPSALVVVYGRGESMLPRIHDGDAILVDTSDTAPKDEKLYVVHAQGPRGPEYSAKRCRDFDGLIFFDSLNPDGDHGWRKPRRMDDPKRPITIVGRVRWIGSWED